jgi:ATP-dependent protease HslVU (ClpYQ) peptidase subunit
MTTILTCRTPKKVYMLADTESGLGDNIRTFKAKKSYNIDNRLIAISGALLQGYKTLNNCPTVQDTRELLNYLAENTKGEEERYASFVVCDKKNTYYVAHGGYCPQSEEFFAIGSGTEIAYGAYEAYAEILEMPLTQLEEVMRICMQRNPGTGGGIDILELDLEK